MQKDTFGNDDSRCQSTIQKIYYVEQQATKIIIDETTTAGLSTMYTTTASVNEGHEV